MITPGPGGRLRENVVQAEGGPGPCAVLVERTTMLELGDPAEAGVLVGDD